jgi:bifunctional DNA-binding transcriptional regulator/antitoxin component of YhaV-PrlF toxin-antitoxin module
MRVESWVIALAIRLPADLVEALGLKEGDEVELRIVDRRTVEIARATSPSGAKPLSRVSASPAGSCRRVGNSTATTPTRVRGHGRSASLHAPQAGRPSLEGRSVIERV